MPMEEKVIEKRKGVVTRRVLKEALRNRREPMNKNRMTRSMVPPNELLPGLSLGGRLRGG
jgi:hypothetical protein